ncbi:MAG: hypothetical protein EHM12_02265 [Dehalococcoidia bacterium]|nr:MAG: hypothetical protein EHM12_02265 [Dehalococcoidia bacterium]
MRGPINPRVKNILSALAVAVLGFILLNITFLLNFLLFKLIDLSLPHELVSAFQWFPMVRHALFLVIIMLVSWAVLRSKLSTLYKAIYLIVPVAVVIVSIGIFMYQWPPAAYLVAGIFTAGILFYLYCMRQPWLYYYAVLLVALTLMVFTLLGGQI